MSKVLQEGGQVRVLVVDSDCLLVHLLTYILGESGHLTRMANDAAEALQIAQEFEPQALIADAHLPDVDGWTLAAQIQERFSDCQVLLMSAGVGMHHPPISSPHYRLVPKQRLFDELPWLFRSVHAIHRAACMPPGPEH